MRNLLIVGSIVVIVGLVKLAYVEPDSPKVYCSELFTPAIGVSVPAHSQVLIAQSILDNGPDHKELFTKLVDLGYSKHAVHLTVTKCASEPDAMLDNMLLTSVYGLVYNTELHKSSIFDNMK